MTDNQEQSSLIDQGPDDENGNPSEDPPADPPEDAPAGAAEPPEDAEEMPFEEAIEELEGIVEDLEDGELPLEDAMERFERGLGLVKTCRSKLEQAELKVEELLEDGSTREIE